jgi:diguanylate cyclase (GGDEF)-like protein
MTVQVLSADLPADAVPINSPAGEALRGERVQVLLPYKKEGTWLRVTVGALPPEPRLVVNGVSMDHVTLVMPGARRIARSKTEPSDDPSASSVAAVFVLPPDIEAGTVLWLHSADRHRNLVDLRLLSASEWRAYERFTIAFAVALYGVFAAFVVIAAIYWTILRERMFADHASYLLSLLVFMSMSSGLFYQLFPGGFWARAGIQGQWGFATFAIAFAVGFATRFLDIERLLPRVAHALDIVRLTLIGLAIAVIVAPFELPYFGASVALVLVPLNTILVVLGFYVATKRSRYALYFLLGWIPLTLCTDMRALQATGTIEVGYEMSLFYALGAVWEALVLTAGIADRALSFRRERDVAQHLARHDGLTGVLNRRAAGTRLEELFRRSRDSGTPLAVFFLDLDHFKSINDRYGHAAGDAVLVAVARRVAAQLRADDVLGRWGGEEFVAVLPGAPPEVVRAMGERIRRAVEAEPVVVEAERIPVTVSVGVAMLAADASDSAVLLQRADEALYRAKDNGRNRVEEAIAAA